MLLIIKIIKSYYDYYRVCIKYIEYIYKYSKNKFFEKNLWLIDKF